MNISKRIFKLALTLSVLSAMLLSGLLWPSVNVATGASPNSNAAALPQLKIKLPKISISIFIGRAKKKCGGFGLCKITLGAVSAADRARTVNAELTTTDDGKLHLTFLGKAPDEGPTLFVDDDITLSSEIAQKLGVKSATIHKGEYAFSGRKSLLNARLTK